MTVTVSWIGGVIGAAAAAVFATTAGIVSPASPDWMIYAVVVGGLAAGTVAWMFSPIPDDTGGIASTDPLRGRYWGFHPGPLGSKPTHVSWHETEPRVLFYFDRGALAVDLDSRLKEWADTPEGADEKLRSRIQREEQ